MPDEQDDRINRTLPEEVEREIAAALATTGNTQPKPEPAPQPEREVNIIEARAGHVYRIIDNERRAADRLEAEIQQRIDEIEERRVRLRHHRLSIDAFTLAIEKLRP